ncbi:hypothetical protein Q4Q39_17450 [Flavivirga amylovorans]|uniref:Uncharacterized protein n=1 Tax=Flavivirga amylovorans TaxID=870486 RepID=A0ABT8X5C4_9FLAO|nr:hypothetical protein [Flavivirga amylovorans]MDO5989193.1 hypothetical protein [Flavivirga amylovorans]
MEKEYYSVSEVSKRMKLSGKQIRNRIIYYKESGKYKNLLIKDSNGRWQIHRMIITKFKPVRIRGKKYYALTVDPNYTYKESEIKIIMEYVVELLPIKGIEISYTIEKKKANGQNHIHLYTNCSNRKKLIKTLRVAIIYPERWI